MTQQHRLLRVSDFCRRPVGGESSYDTDATPTSSSSSSSVLSAPRLPIHIQAIPDDDMAEELRVLTKDSIVTAAGGAGGEHGDNNSRGIRADDIHNSVILEGGSPEKILSRLSLMNGGLVMLSYSTKKHSSRTKTESNNNNNNNTVVVRLFLGAEQPKENGNHDNAMPATITVSSTLAATVGCAWPSYPSSDSFLLDAVPRFTPVIQDTHSTGFLQEFCSYSDIHNSAFKPQLPDTLLVPAAESVTLNCLGFPILLATADSIVWPRPPDGCLVSELSLMRVQDPISRLYVYYEVLGVQSGLTTTQYSGKISTKACYQTTLVTEYKYVNDNAIPCHGDSGICRRLPPLHQSPSTQYGSEGVAMRRNPPHPDLPNLLHLLQGISTQAISGERIFPLVGTDHDHNVRELVQSAAASLGMRCLSVKGLAAFAAANRHPVTTGSLADQLEGLQIAVTQAQKCAPCILHLVDLDLEFTSQQHDPSMRDEQEDRVWSALVDALDNTVYQTATSATDDEGASGDETPSSTSSKQLSSIRHRGQSSILKDDEDPRWAPSLLIIISTTKPLAKISASGPLAQKLVYDALTLSLPTVDYATYLWQEQTRMNGGDKHDAGFTLEHFQDLLRERSVHDICILQEKWLGIGDQARSSPEEQRQIMVQLCQDLDKQRRSQTSNSNSSSSVKIANVKWDDVGGLTQVRLEIMDTIELPLKYPHFFPNGGRSGILLYGPPGTGKTLVAKAVATECNIPFLSVKGPELLGSFVGESEANVRGVFANAREAALAAGGSRDPTQQQPGTESTKAPKACLVFFDELDSLAPRRADTASGSGGGVMDRVVATLAAELDKGQQRSSSKESTSGKRGSDDENCYIFVLGATNRPDLLDPGLLRPGRFDRMVYLGVALTPEDRAKILAAQIRHLEFEQGKTPLEIAEAIVDQLPSNLTGADLSSIGSGALARATERLCKEADQEVEQRMKQIHSKALANGDNTTSNDNYEEDERAVLDEVLSEWDESRLVPTVTIQDMLEASKDIIPSVSHADLERYERLRQQFSSSSTSESI